MPYTSIHKALAESVATTLRGMIGTDITGIVADSIRVRKAPWMGDFGSIDPITSALPAGKSHQLPAIVICYADERLSGKGTNKEDEIEYPLNVIFARQNNLAGEVASEDNDDVFLRWREVVERTYTHLRGIAGQGVTVTANGNNYTFFDCRISFGPVYDFSRFGADGGNIDAGWLKLGFVTWRLGGA